MTYAEEVAARMEMDASPPRSVAKFIIIGVLAVVFVVMAGCSFTKVGQGHVGVRVNNLGSNAGVDPAAKGVGWYFTPPGVTIYEYPVYTSNYTWKGDDKFTFQDRNGLSVSADVSVAYRADPHKAPVLFQKYRTDMDGILQGPVRNTLRNAIVTEASVLSVDQIYGPQKAALIERARKRADAYLDQFGLHIEQLFWASNINLPESIQAQINARVANEQQAIAEQAKVATAQAQAAAAVARAKGKAEATQVEAEAIRTNPEILQQRAIERWNGRLPVYMAPNAPLPFIGGAVK